MGSAPGKKKNGNVQKERKEFKTTINNYTIWNLSLQNIRYNIDQARNDGSASYCLLPCSGDEDFEGESGFKVAKTARVSISYDI